MAIRTYEEMVDRCRNPVSMFGFDSDVILSYLPYEHAKKFLKDGVLEETWNDHRLEDAKSNNIESYDLTRKNIIDEMRHYMDFAIGKALDHRGLSAGRSVEKMEAWIWLLGDDVIDEPYPNYGVPILLAICDRYGFDWQEGLDEAELNMLRRMGQGKSCIPGCIEGCGKV